MSLADLLTDTIVIKTKTTSTNAWGEEEISSWATTTSASAKVYPISDEMRLQLQGDFQDAEYKIILPTTTTISYGERITWDSTDWQILSILKDSRNHHYEILIKRL